MNMRFLTKTTLPFLAIVIVICVGLTFSGNTTPYVAASVIEDSSTQSTIDLNECPWMDTTLTPDQRARLLLDASSLEQKMRWLVEPSANNPDETEFGGGFGIPAVSYPQQVPCTPVIQYTDGPAALSGAGSGITAFPAQIALAASWNLDLSREKGAAHAYEAFYKHRNVILGPGLASGRVPYLGRNAEYFGEDPLLGGWMAAANVRGIQEDTPSNVAVEAVVKHYVANEQEFARQSSSSNIDERTLHQLYTLPYEIAIKEGNPGGVMCAFNQVNGVWSCESAEIQQEILKDQIGFKGWVVSDFFSVHSVADSLVNGMDQELVGPRLWNKGNLQAALDAGEITEAHIDESAFRIVRSHIMAGLFDTPLPPGSLDDVSTPENQAIARRVAEEGSVLLKNEDILPLAGSGQTIAVIGPTASISETNGISAETACAYNRPGIPCTPVAPLDGITARAEQDGNTVVFDNGADLASAAATAASADVAIVFGYYEEGEGEDRPNLNLDSDGDALVEAVAAANDNTVVVLQTGGPVLMPWIDDVSGVLEVWYAGQEMGNAIAALLWGDVNPSGKLPQTFPVSEADLPTAGSEAQYPGIEDEEGIYQVDYSEGLLVGYRWYDEQEIEPLFPFGFGLSYTTFEYADLSVSHAARSGSQPAPINVSFRVTNTGDVAGTEIPQMYLTLPDAVGEPPLRLVGWDRVTLEAGESVEIQLTIDPNSSDHPLSYWDVDQDEWVTAPGEYTIHVGSSSRDLPLNDSVTVMWQSYLPIIFE